MTAESSTTRDKFTPAVESFLLASAVLGVVFALVLPILGGGFGLLSLALGVSLRSRGSGHGRYGIAIGVAVIAINLIALVLPFLPGSGRRKSPSCPRRLDPNYSRGTTRAVAPGP